MSDDRKQNQKAMHVSELSDQDLADLGKTKTSPWKRTGEVGLLPLDARLRLKKAAATPNRRDRLIAISEAEAWVKSTYPEYFQPEKE